MEYDPKTPPSHTGDKTSFGFLSARDRWPVILTGAIDDIHRATSLEKDPEKAEEGKKITQGLATLKYELQHNRQMTPLPDDGGSDIAGYNEELAQRGNPHWFDVSWLYSECYLYRRIATLFALSTHWKSHDVFAAQKLSTFRSSRPAVLELATRYNALTHELQHPDTTATPAAREQADELLFTEICTLSLWGNATDLSLLTNLSYADIQALQNSEARKANEKNVLVNDLPAAFAALSKAKQSASSPDHERRVDIVLDNAGFELFVDLLLAGYLLHAGLATQIVLRPKNIPWFVSDVVPRDFAALLSALLRVKEFYETPSETEINAGETPPPLSEAEERELGALCADWSSLYAEGKIVMRANDFWTEGGSYWRLPHTAPKLFEDLKEAELVVWKGDLNYRKLTGDAMWDPTTPFADAIGPLGPGSGVRILALRTCKADVVVGLPKGRDEELRGGDESGCRKWAWSGKYAVASFCDGKA